MTTTSLLNRAYGLGSLVFVILVGGLLYLVYFVFCKLLGCNPFGIYIRIVFPTLSLLVIFRLLTKYRNVLSTLHEHNLSSMLSLTDKLGSYFSPTLVQFLKC